MFAFCAAKPWNGQNPGCPLSATRRIQTAGRAPMAFQIRRGAKSLRLLGAALLAIGFFGLAQGAAADIRQAPNSRTALEIPERFQPSDRFSGFIDDQSGASFLIVEMPAIAYEE